MPWIELNLYPEADWDDVAFEDWSYALCSFLAEKEQDIRPNIRALPGYYILTFEGFGKPGEIIFSGAERMLFLSHFSLYDLREKELAHFILRFAQQLGAAALRSLVQEKDEKDFWESLGGKVQPDPVPLKESIRKEKVAVERLYKFSLLVTYKNKPVLCLEPIFCNAHAPGPVSLAQRRLEKLLGGKPLGFASRVSARCPWELERKHWDDLLAFSRLQAFDLFSRLVNDGMTEA